MLTSIVSRAAELNRTRKWLLIVVLDSLLLLGSLALGLLLTSGFYNWSVLFLTWQALLFPVLAHFVFRYFRVYKTVIRFLTGRVAWSLIKATTIAHFLLWMLTLLSIPWNIYPQSLAAIIVSYLLSIILLVGIRYAARSLIDATDIGTSARQRVAIYGLSPAARELARTMTLGSEMKPVLFLTDDPELARGEANGADIKLAKNVARLVEQYKVDRLIVVADAVSETDRRNLLARLYEKPLTISLLPAINDLLKMSSPQSFLRRLEVEDFLGRKPHATIVDLVRQSIENKTVLITGAAGSIGSELCRQALAGNPRKLIMLDQSESALVPLARELSRVGKVSFEIALGSLLDPTFVNSIFKRNDIDVVFHAAAFKHVDIAEHNVASAIRNNVFSTYQLTKAALDSGVPSMVMISTDKAVHPSNIMGATKNWSEQIVCGLGMRAAKLANRASGKIRPVPRYCAVRFGNVFRSSGSVVPLFEEQVSRGGPVTITSREMTRYFMSIDEAAGLILQVAGLSEGGEVFLLDMGEPLKIIEIAKTIIRISGHTLKDETNPDGDIEIVETGIRAGEKLHEELFSGVENVVETLHPGILKAALESGVGKSPEKLEKQLSRLDTLLTAGDVETAKTVLFEQAADAEKRGVKTRRQTAAQ